MVNVAPTVLVEPVPEVSIVEDNSLGSGQESEISSADKMSDLFEKLDHREVERDEPIIARPTLIWR